jgi:hypothetical protein
MSKLLLIVGIGLILMVNGIALFVSLDSNNPKIDYSWPSYISFMTSSTMLILISINKKVLK